MNAIIELTNERMIKYLNNAIFLIDFFRNMLRLIRFNTVPISPIGTTVQRKSISCSQLDLIFESSKIFGLIVVFSIFFENCFF